ncbi:hypothetical protein [Rhizobium sp. NZLR1]|uniref:hypothetical protein n=1 Tax=Rhizobium sp. NZLR1 TaxID=2731096 RepID=UPI001A9905B3|nr:hypothetical protein [Rhizobium sp. NZLR1]MBX5205834.1 hypothetical protein [Rhizobium sp. NZLR1]QSZ20260.1 hypothetical protein J3O30_18365 [Rhizobium sp. NZLR1]
MEKLSKTFGLLLKALGAILVGLIALSVIVIVLSGWSASNTERASYECVLRRMDHHIADESTGAYHDTCMASMGYKRLTGCASLNLVASPAFCFAPAWQAWR